MTKNSKVQYCADYAVGDTVYTRAGDGYIKRVIEQIKITDEAGTVKYGFVAQNEPMSIYLGYGRSRDDILWFDADEITDSRSEAKKLATRIEEKKRLRKIEKLQKEIAALERGEEA